MESFIVFIVFNKWILFCGYFRLSTRQTFKNKNYALKLRKRSNRSLLLDEQALSLFGEICFWSNISISTHMKTHGKIKNLKNWNCFFSAYYASKTPHLGIHHVELLVFNFTKCNARNSLDMYGDHIWLINQLYIFYICLYTADLHKACNENGRNIFFRSSKKSKTLSVGKCNRHVFAPNNTLIVLSGVYHRTFKLLYLYYHT